MGDSLGLDANYPPCVTFRLVVAPLRGPGRSPVLPFVLDVAWRAVCASVAPSSWRIEDVLVVVGVV